MSIVSRELCLAYYLPLMTFFYAYSSRFGALETTLLPIVEYAEEGGRYKSRMNQIGVGAGPRMLTHAERG